MSLQAEWTNKTDAAVDEKLGLISIKVPYTISPGTSKVLTLLHALSVLPDEVTDLGIPLVKRDCKERDDGGYDVTFTLDGVRDPAGADGEEFSLDGTTTDEKIEAHPELQMLVEKYFPAGTSLKSAVNSEGRVIFPVTLSVNGQETPNPLHGIETYLLPGLVWTRTRVQQEFPVGLTRQLGKVGVPPRGSAGQRVPSDAGPEWIMARLKADWRGNVWRISESWLNSGPNGFPPDVYRYR